MGLCAVFLLAARYALAQENVDGIEWDYEAYEDPAEMISGLMICAPILGACFGMVRVITSRFARPLLAPELMSQGMPKTQRGIDFCFGH